MNGQLQGLAAWDVDQTLEATIGRMIPESDWRVLRGVHRRALDRYCTHVLEESAEIIQMGDTSPHDRYLQLYRFLKERDRNLATAFDDLRRSTALQRLAAMILLDVVTDQEINQFTAATREAAIALADISRR